MTQSYQDCMAIVRACGNPTLFITMTTNPQWAEIREAIDVANHPHRSAPYRPDIVARVFNLKLQALMDELVKDQIFGQVLGWTYVVEYQKRGLPHAHILLILHPRDRPQTPEQIDAIVCAELPDPDTNPRLYNTVVNSMIHRPCGSANPNSPCMKNNFCTKRYPRDLVDQTTLQEDGYPIYRRRARQPVVHNGVSIDNSWVVPYNPYLCHKYDSHINVEMASSISSVKYLFKYVYKGHDRAAFVVHSGQVNNLNQIQRTSVLTHSRSRLGYLDARYISPAEAVYRLFSFPITEHKPAVTRLQIHVDDQRSVSYHGAENGFDVLDRSKPSSLEAFFTFCRDNPQHVRGLLYPDAPAHLTWDRSSAKWKLRHPSSPSAIGRIRWVSPAAQEVSPCPHFQQLTLLQEHYLRLLLLHIPAPTSFKFLRTVSGHELPTFKAACAAYGLLKDDNEYDVCLDTAAQFKSGYALRALFILLLTNKTVTIADPVGLFERHKHQLSDDCRRRLERDFRILSPTPEQILDLALSDLQTLAETAGETMASLKLPPPTDSFGVSGSSTELAAERAYDRTALAQVYNDGLATANADQRRAIDEILASVRNADGRIFFLDGPGGCGKTYVESVVLASLRSRGAIAIAVASSGVAAQLLPGGRTAHNRFKIPIDLKETSSCAIPAQSTSAELFRAADLIIWDEAVMQNKNAFKAVDRMLQDIRNSRRHFGGVTMLFAGTSPLFTLTYTYVSPR